MSDSNRSERGSALAIVGSFIAVLCLAALLFTFGQILGQQQGYQQEATAKHQRDAQSYVAEACRDVEATSLFECVYNAAEAAQDSQRSEQDLSAQQGMHFWAVGMVIVGLLQTAVAGGALFLLMKDLRQNRESAEAQLRAYITITDVKFRVAPENKIKASVDFKNSGTTPARELRVHLTIHIQDWPEYLPLELPDKSSEWHKSTAVVGAGGEAAISNDQGLKDGLVAREVFDRACLIAQGHIEYVDVFGKQRATRFRYFSDQTTRRLGHGAVAAPQGNSLT